MNWTDNQISNQLNFMAESIQTMIQPFGGQCQVVDDENMMWMQAWNSSAKLVVYLTWVGDRPWGPLSIAGITHRVTRDWIVGVKRGRGYKSTRGDSFSKDGTVPAFVDMVDIIRNFIRGMLGISEDAAIDNVTVSKWSQGAQVMSGRLIRFSTQNDLQQILMQPDNAFSYPNLGVPQIIG